MAISIQQRSEIRQPLQDQAENKHSNIFFNKVKKYFEQKLHERTLNSLKGDFVKKVKNCQKKMSFPKGTKINIVFSRIIFGTPYASGIASKYVTFPISLILKKKHLPEKFHINGENDPRLNSEKFLNEFYDWALEFLRISPRGIESRAKISKLVYSYNPQLSKTLLILINDPEKYEKAKSFIICHELAHQRLGHIKRIDENRNKNFFSRMHHTHTIEKEADQQSLFTLQDNKEGARFLFQTFSKSLPFTLKYLYVLTHGTFHSRSLDHPKNHIHE